MDPTKSLAQTATSCCNQPSPGSNASNVLILKSMVPKNCSAQLSQPISRGFQPKTARCFGAGRSDSAGSPAFAAWKSCKYAAVVKGIEPAKKITFGSRDWIRFGSGDWRRKAGADHPQT